MVILEHEASVEPTARERRSELYVNLAEAVAHLVDRRECRENNRRSDGLTIAGECQIIQDALRIALLLPFGKDAVMG